MQILILLKSFVYCCAARVVLLFRPSAADYFVVGSNYGQSVDPNAVALMRQLASEQRRVVCITDRVDLQAVDYVKRGSFMGVRLLLGAKAVFYTHSLSDVLPNGHKLPWFKGVLGFPVLVFLQHGVIGLKKMLPNGGTMASYVSSLEATFDHMIVSSEWEKRLVEKMGVPGRKIAVTGLPRFDDYVADGTSKTSVLVFFTWHKDGCSEEKYQQVKNSIGCQALQREGYSINDAKHHMQFSGNDYRVRDKNAKVLRDTVLDCALLITDDSSVAWDVLYQGGEVLFFQSSPQWLIEDSTLAEHVCHSISELDDRIQSWLSGDAFPKYQFAAYQDQNNSQRVIDLVVASKP